MSSPTQPVPPAPLSDDTVKVWKRITETEPRKWHNEDVKRLLATISDRDKRLTAVIALCDETEKRTEEIYQAPTGAAPIWSDKVRSAAEGRTP